jgi:hypothetical protein
LNGHGQILSAPSLKTWRPETAIISVTRCGPPLANFNPNGQGKHRNTHQNRSSKSIHINNLSHTLILGSDRLSKRNPFPADGSKYGNFGIKFLSTFKTYPVCPFLDRKHPAHLAVMAPDDELKESQQEFHKA